jgi:transcriptional regulator with XRE-family HTH domain
VKEALQKFGAELTKQREAKGLSVSQLSAITKIAESYLTKMEQGEFDFLPRVYVRAFLRSISQEIGLDPEVMVRRLAEITIVVKEEAVPVPVPENAIKEIKEEEPGAEKPGSPAEKPRQKVAVTEPREMEEAPPEKSATPWINPFTIGLAVVAVTLVLFILMTSGEKKKAEEIDSGIAVAPVGAKVVPQQDTLIPIATKAGIDTSTQKEMALTVRAVETAWVRIVHHDSLAEEGLFAAGESRTFSSRSPFYLKIGNAGGIQLVLDRRELGAAGDKGKVANLKVSSEGVTSVTFAEFPPAMSGSQP